MFTRLNFLFSVSVLTLFLFYSVGRFILLHAVTSFAPAMVPYFSAAYGLGALMLAVLILAKTVIMLEPFASAARRHGGTMWSVAAQAILLVAHLCAIFAVYAKFTLDTGDSAWWPWLLASALYGIGVATAVADWRQHDVQPAA